MNKGIKLIKRAVALVLVLLFSINTFAALVGDNDGAAFITKAEFDSMKNDFQSQLDRYNSSIDNKVDGAIASYLAGVRIRNVTTEKFFDGSGMVVLICDTSKINDLKWGTVSLDIVASTSKHPSMMTGGYPIVRLIIYLSRTTNAPFESFAYDPNTNHLSWYADDVRVQVSIDSLHAEQANSQAIGSIDADHFELRWHGDWNDNKRDIVAYPPYYDRDRQVKFIQTGKHSSWNTWVANPNWLMCYPNGVNCSLQGYRDNAQFTSYSCQTSYLGKTEIKTIFDDSINSNEVQLWIPLNSDGLIDDLCLNSDYRSDPTAYAKTYDKTGRTLAYELPSDAGVTIKNKMCWASNNTGSNMVSFTNDSAIWTKYGRYNEYYTAGPITAGYWHEIYFEPDSKKSKDIINASANDVMLNEYSGFGWTGSLVEGLPIVTLKPSAQCQFEMTLPYELALGFKSNPFTTDYYVRNTPIDSDLKIYIDDIELTTSAGKVLTSGKHQFKIVNNNDTESNAVFMKIGRPSTDDSSSKRYKLTLPKTITVIS